MELTTVWFILIAILWVGYNNLSPLTNQLGRMSEMKEDADVATAKPKRR